jgi:outer membrane protein OmpA-like peptidoglycan-associated protein
MKNKLFLSAACFALCIGMLAAPGKAGAQEMGTLPYYSISEEEYRNHYYEWRMFLQYHLSREPCQHYREPPPGFELRGCDVYRVGTSLSEIQPSAGEETQTTTTRTETQSQNPHYSTIYFDFDRSNVRADQREELDMAVNEINKSNPSRITIAGHADRAGPAEYNVNLSQRRADTVTEELVAKGVRNDVIEEKAYGETDPAVPTEDGVPLQENRRAVIYFQR